MMEFALLATGFGLLIAGAVIDRQLTTMSVYDKLETVVEFGRPPAWLSLCLMLCYLSALVVPIYVIWPLTWWQWPLWLLASSLVANFAIATMPRFGLVSPYQAIAASSMLGATCVGVSALF